MHHQLDDGPDDTLQVCRLALTVEKETAIVGMSQKAWLVQCIFFCSMLESAVDSQTMMRVQVKNAALAACRLSLARLGFWMVGRMLIFCDRPIFEEDHSH